MVKSIKSSISNLVRCAMITPTIIKISVLKIKAANTQNSWRKCPTSGLILVFPLPVISKPIVTKPIIPDQCRLSAIKNVR